MDDSTFRNVTLTVPPAEDLPRRAQQYRLYGARIEGVFGIAVTPDEEGTIDDLTDSVYGGITDTVTDALDLEHLRSQTTDDRWRFIGWCHVQQTEESGREVALTIELFPMM